jgi:hypothetical protein
MQIVTAFQNTFQNTFARIGSRAAELAPQRMA